MKNVGHAQEKEVLAVLNPHLTYGGLGKGIRYDNQNPFHITWYQRDERGHGNSTCRSGELYGDRIPSIKKWRIYGPTLHLLYHIYYIDLNFFKF